MGLSIGFVILLLAVALFLFFSSTGQSGSQANLETILGMIRGVA